MGFAHRRQNASVGSGASARTGTMKIVMSDSNHFHQHYIDATEDERLTRGAGRLEALRTWTVLDRHLPAAPAVILDVGGGPDYFTTAFFHHPDELRLEMNAAAFSVLELVGLEGPAWMSSELDRWIEDDEMRERLLGWLARVEQEPLLLGASAHLLAVATNGRADE